MEIKNFKQQWEESQTKNYNLDNKVKHESNGVSHLSNKVIWLNLTLILLWKYA